MNAPNTGRSDSKRAQQSQFIFSFSSVFFHLEHHLRSGMGGGGLASGMLGPSPSGCPLKNDGEPYRLFMLKCRSIKNLARSLKQKRWRVKLTLRTVLNNAFYSGHKACAEVLLQVLLASSILFRCLIELDLSRFTNAHGWLHFPVALFPRVKSTLSDLAGVASVQPRRHKRAVGMCYDVCHEVEPRSRVLGACSSCCGHDQRTNVIKPNYRDTIHPMKGYPLFLLPFHQSARSLGCAWSGSGSDTSPRRGDGR